MKTMKKTLKFFMLVTLVTTMTSCDLDELLGSLGIGNATVSATIKGDGLNVSFSSDKLVSLASHTEDYLYVNGVKTDLKTQKSKALNITVYGEYETGKTYNVKNQSSQQAYGQFIYIDDSSDAENTTYTTVVGETDFTFSLKKYTDTEVEGTFSGTMIADDNRSITVTNGKFKASYETNNTN